MGPSGEPPDRALAELGMERDPVDVTNPVKHFNFDARARRAGTGARPR